MLNCTLKNLTSEWLAETCSHRSVILAASKPKCNPYYFCCYDNLILYMNTLSTLSSACFRPFGLQSNRRVFGCFAPFYSHTENNSFYAFLFVNARVLQLLLSRLPAALHYSLYFRACTIIPEQYRKKQLWFQNLKKGKLLCISSDYIPEFDKLYTMQT